MSAVLYTSPLNKYFFFGITILFTNLINLSEQFGRASTLLDPCLSQDSIEQFVDKNGADTHKLTMIRL